MEGECFAIRIYKSDPVFGRVQKCFPFIRANHEEDPQGVRQQINEVTTWLDASFVYGSDELTAELLRDGNKVFFSRRQSDSEQTDRNVG